MPNLMTITKDGSGTVQPSLVALGGSGDSALFGPLERETKLASTYIRRAGTHRAAQMNEYVYCCHGSSGKVRIYKGFPSALKLRITGAVGGTGTFTAGETITGAPSGATGTTIEDYVGSEVFVNYTPVTGTFADNDTLSFSGGGTATCTASGNPENNNGEWGVDIEGADSLETNQLDNLSGLLGVRSATGETTLALLYLNTSNVFKVLTLDAAGNWNETTGAGTGIFLPNRTGAAYSFKNVIYYLYAFNTGSSGNATGIITHNASSGSTSVGSTGVAATDFGGRSHIVAWRDRIFGLFPEANTNKALLIEVTGATFTTRDSITAAGAPFQGFNPQEQSCLFVGPDDDALYAFSREHGSGEIRVCRWIYDTDGSTIIRSAPQAYDNNGVTDLDIGEVMVPTSARTGMGPQIGVAKFRDLDSVIGSQTLRFWLFSTASGAATEYTYSNLSDVNSGASATWNGTTGNSNDVVFGTSVAAELTAGDWIRHKTSNKMFRVEAVSTTDVQISNNTGSPSPAIAQTVPTTASAVDKVVVWGTAGIGSGMGGMALPSGDVSGGGHVFTSGEYSGKFIGSTPIVGGARLSYKVYDSASGSPTVMAKGYFLDKNQVLAQMTLFGTATGGSSTRSGDQVNSVTADNGATTYTFDWNSTTDGISDGDTTHKYLNIFV